MLYIRPLIRHTRFIALLAAAILSQTAQAAKQSPAWQASTEAESVQIPDANHELTIVLFWATWCPYCKQLMPHLQSILDEYPDHSIRVLAPTIKEDGDPAGYLTERGYDFDWIEQGDPIAAKYMIMTTPGVIIIDGAGDIIFDLRTVRAQQPRVSDDSPHWRKAARLAPYWAARIRQAVRQSISES